MTGLKEKPFADQEKSTFIARTSAWDSFVIYGIDPSKSTARADMEEEQPKAPIGLPPPPAHALPVPACGPALPIYYNQPVILQCVNTGVISPPMVIRQVDTGSMAVGGGSKNPNTIGPVSAIPSAPGEDLGDAVCQ